MIKKKWFKALATCSGEGVGERVHGKYHRYICIYICVVVICSGVLPFLVSSPVAFKYFNVLVLNIAEKLLAGR